MAVYVDDPIIVRHGRRWSHLLADTLEELHAFAERLGLPPLAFQDKRSGAHYDLDEVRRARALQLGAIALNRHRDRTRLRQAIAAARAQARRTD